MVLAEKLSCTNKSSNQTPLAKSNQLKAANQV